MTGFDPVDTGAIPVRGILCRRVYILRYYIYNMKITKKIVKVAQSLGVIIDKPVVDKLKLKKGDYIEIEIKKLE